ncbi:MAG: hypothetical protein ACI37T_03800 [Candidatus Gastranaerophilaceae bacterium]
MNKFWHKILSLLIIFCLSCNSICYAAHTNFTNNNRNENYSFECNSNEIIHDFLIENYPDKSIKIQNNITEDIQDILIDQSFIQEHSMLPDTEYTPVYDSFAEVNLAKFSKVSYTKKIYDFENINNIKIKIKSKKLISTKNIEEEGQIVDFIVAEDVIFNEKIIIPKNSIIQARVETISPNMSKGIPADLVIGSFKYKNYNLDGEISKTGANRLYWVLPTAFVMNTLFFGCGYVLWAIRGGHAKFRPNQIFEINLPEDIKTALLNRTTANK